MPVFLTFTLLIFLVLLLILMVWAMIGQFAYSFNPRRIVLFPTFLDWTAKKNLRAIIQKYCPETKQQTLLEIGCGSAHTTHWLAKEFTWQKAVGVEVDFLTFQLARIVNHLARTKIDLVRADIFEHQFPQNSVLYCYLTEIMKQLYQMGKFQNCLVISLTFSIEGVEPTQNLPLPGAHHRFLIYDFR